MGVNFSALLTWRWLFKGVRLFFLVFRYFKDILSETLGGVLMIRNAPLIIGLLLPSWALAETTYDRAGKAFDRREYHEAFALWKECSVTGTSRVNSLTCHHMVCALGMLLREGFTPNFEDTLNSCKVVQQSAHLVPTLIKNSDFSLGWHYEFGLGVPQDRHLAESYFKMAAGRGAEDALRYLSHREQEYPQALAAYRARGVGAGLRLAAEPPLAKSDLATKNETKTVESVEKSERSIEDMPRYKGQQRGGDFALIVGVEKYSDLPPAEYAANDAQAVRNHVSGMGIPDRNIIFLENQAATKGQLLAYLDEWLPKNLKDGSRLITYFSGHGSVDPQTGSPYLMPWDGKPAFLRSTAISISDVVAKLQNLQGVDSLLILDSCFSGAGGRSVLPKGARPLVVEMPKLSVAGSRVSVLAATSEGEVTVANDEAKHGAFTFALLREWNRQLGTGKESVSLKTIFKPLSEQVQDFSRRQNIIQTPKLIEATKEFQFGPSAKRGGGG